MNIYCCIGIIYQRQKQQQWQWQWPLIPVLHFILRLLFREIDSLAHTLARTQHPHTDHIRTRIHIWMFDYSILYLGCTCFTYCENRSKPNQTVWLKQTSIYRRVQHSDAKIIFKYIQIDTQTQIYLYLLRSLARPSIEASESVGAMLACPPLESECIHVQRYQFVNSVRSRENTWEQITSWGSLKWQTCFKSTHTHTLILHAVSGLPVFRYVLSVFAHELYKSFVFLSLSLTHSFCHCECVCKLNTLDCTLTYCAGTFAKVSIFPRTSDYLVFGLIL